MPHRVPRIRTGSPRLPMAVRCQLRQHSVLLMDRPGFEPGPSPCDGDARPFELPARVICDSRSWDRTSSLRYVRPALSPLSYPRMNEKAPEGSRTPVSSLEDWCLDRSATEAKFPAGESNSALWVKSPVHHAPMLARGEERYRTSPPGRSRTSVIPRIRRVLAPGLSYGRKIRWGGLEPPPRGSRPRALPGELRTC